VVSVHADVVENHAHVVSEHADVVENHALMLLGARGVKEDHVAFVEAGAGELRSLEWGISTHAPNEQY